MQFWKLKSIIIFFVSVPIFSFNMCMNCRNVTKFYKNCRYFSTTVPLSKPNSHSPEPEPFHQLRLKLKSPAPAPQHCVTVHSIINIGVFKSLHVLLWKLRRKLYWEDSISGASELKLEHFYKYLLRYQSKSLNTFYLGLKYPCLTEIMGSGHWCSTLPLVPVLNRPFPSLILNKT